MSQTRRVYWGGSKGGVGKSTDAHLSCLGAILCNQAAAYVLTDRTAKSAIRGGPMTSSMAGSLRTSPTY